jgi:hypothetical protein
MSDVTTTLFVRPLHSVEIWTATERRQGGDRGGMRWLALGGASGGCLRCKTLQFRARAQQSHVTAPPGTTGFWTTRPTVRAVYIAQRERRRSPQVGIEGGC